MLDTGIETQSPDNLHLEIGLDRFFYSFQEVVHASCLCVASGKGWNCRYEVAIFVLFNQDTEIFFHDHMLLPEYSQSSIIWLGSSLSFFAWMESEAIEMKPAIQSLSKNKDAFCSGIPFIRIYYD